MKQIFDGDREELRTKIWSLDLEPIIFKLMDEEEGEGWTLEQSLMAVEEYRRFLLLTVTSTTVIVPTKFVDSVWHTHILDTMKYMDDCQQLFGFYVHHFPYFGMRGDEDQTNLQTAFKAAADVYESTFGQSYYVGINGASCGTCGANSCGKCGGSGITNQINIVRTDVRPSLAMASR
jgi:hypothetical protein